MRRAWGRFAAVTVGLPCFAHIGRDRTASHGYLPVFDGVRGVAALLVIAQHVFHARPVYGLCGVWLFFVLSGMLLSHAWYRAGPRPGWRFLGRYYLRRVRRILPMYIVAVWVIALVVPLNTTWVYLHLTFQRAEYVLWTIRQELLFYALLPLLMWPLSRGAGPLGMALIAATAALLAALFLPASVLSLGSWRADLQGDVPFFFAMFALGVAAGGVAHAPQVSRIAAVWQWPREVTALPLVAVLIVLYLLVPPMYGDSPETWQWHALWGAAIALLFIHLHLWPDRIVARLLASRPLMAVGVVGYSFYLLHIPVIRVMERFGAQGYALLAFSIAGTYICACIAYCLVESPYMNDFFRRRRN